MGVRALQAVGLSVLATASFVVACGSSSPPGNPGDVGSTGSQGSGSGSSGGGGSGSTSSGGPSGGSATGSGDLSGVSSGSGSAGGSSTGSGPTSGSAGTGSSTGASSGSGSGSSTGASSGSSPPPACVKGQVKPNEVVIIGDSYLDTPSDTAGETTPKLYNAIMMAAGGVMYRNYSLAGAAMNNGSGSLNIPYQFNTQALGASKDIKVVIMDGGGNDVLIDQRMCLSDTSPSTDPVCTMAIQGALNAGTTLFKSMAAAGVEHVVYFYYPHLDPAGGGLLPAPAPGVDLSADYALAQLEKSCCGASFTSSTTNYSCRGNAAIGNGQTLDCIVIDTVPAFAGHETNAKCASTPQASDCYIQTDHIHENTKGVGVIANLVWQTMQQDCIAQ